MTIVQTLGGLTDLQPGWYPGVGAFGSMTLYDRYSYDYETIYRTQPSVRKVVDFLARNIAQLGLHVFRRVSDTDRVRITDSELARTLKRPNPQTTRYQFIDGFVRDVCVHGNAYAPKIRLTDGRVGLVLVPPWLMWVKGGLIPGQYTLTYGGKRLEMTPAELLHSRLGGRILGISPLETLRRILAEEAASGAYRERYWQNGARMGVVIKRPADAPEWGDAARTRFRAEFEALYTGELASGRTAILEDGMTVEANSFNAVDSQYLEGRKFNLQEVCTAFHVPPPMVGILDQATFSNIDTQHRMLYQDTLGPWLVMLTEDWELQLLPEFADTADVYLEFNLEEKLRGSFQEQATSLQTLVGRPILTANEGRALLNRPRLDGADGLVTPLNVLIGGQASPRDSLPKGRGVKSDEPTGVVDPTLPDLRDQHRKKWGEVLSAFFGRQRSAVESKLGAVKRRKAAYTIDDIWDAARWDGELEADLFALGNATASVWGEHTAAAFGIELDMALLLAWLQEHARIAAENVNAFTLEGLVAALRGDTPEADIGATFDVAESSRADQIAQSQVNATANFGSHSGAEQAGVRMKTWQQNSANPRSLHLPLNGVSVPLGELFPTSPPMKWPGDPAGGADNVANCQCSVTFDAGGEG